VARRSYGTAADRALRLWVSLARCHASVSRVSADDIRGYGLTQTQFAVLEALYHKGSMPLREVSRKLLVTGGNITFVADQLEKAGLLERRRQADDRRVVHACLTPKGRSLIEKIFPLHADRMRRAAALLTPREQSQLAELLKKWGKSVGAG
jgi:MarR family 2-MHQ and catechol resistance regulon transcriptional repressor